MYIKLAHISIPNNIPKVNNLAVPLNLYADDVIIISRA